MQQHSILQTLTNYAPTYLLEYNTTLADVKKAVFSKAKEAEVRKLRKRAQTIKVII